MPALSPRDLASACRTIYVQAATDTILPPLIRDAADPAPPQRAIEAAGADFTLNFRVVYEDAGAGPVRRPARPPLRFDIAAVAGPDDAPVTLSAAQHNEIVRAYLLGVREPLVVDAPTGGCDWRIGLRIAPRFVMAAAPVRLEAGLSADEICERLASRLFETTGMLFGSRAVGLEVWEARLREELFGEGRRPAHEIWPPIELVAPAPLAARLPAPVRARAVCAAPVVAPRRRALAAACALVGLAALAGALASREAGGEARVAPPRHELSETTPGSGATARTLPAIRLAALERHRASAPEAGDVRFALLAPTVAQAVFSLYPGSLAAPLAVETTPRAAPPMAVPAPSVVQPKKAKSATHLRRPRKPGALARVDRAVKHFVKTIGAKLPRVKLTALNSPQADGPGRH